MARPYKNLRDRMSPGSRKRSEERARRELLEMNLAEIRKNVAHLTQEQIADLLDRTQATVSALEKREDMLLSSLAEYVRVLGGRLELIARFPDQDIRITQFTDIRGQISNGGRR
jgi:ABC-type transporter Mla subunit MlaD